MFDERAERIKYLESKGITKAEDLQKYYVQRIKHLLWQYEYQGIRFSEFMLYVSGNWQNWYESDKKLLCEVRKNKKLTENEGGKNENAF